jgi:hypothetical protein
LLVLGLLLPLIRWLSSVASEIAVEMSLLAVLRRRNGQIGGDEGAGFVCCGQKLPLLEVGWRREGWVDRLEKKEGTASGRKSVSVWART